MTSKRLKRVKRERFLPFAYDPFGLEVEVHAVVLDGQRDVESIEPERRLVTIEEAGWSEAIVRGSVRVPPDLVDRVYPSAERRAPPTRLCMVVRCAVTRVRRAIDLDAPLEPGASFAFELRLERGEAFGTVQLVPFLLRSASASDSEAGFAGSVGSRLASARPWIVRLDRARDPAGEFLDTRYHPFSTDPQLRPYAAALYRLEVSEQPTLWINTDHARIASVLEQEGTRGTNARLREVVFDHISQGVWTQLFVQAAMDLQQGELVFPWEDTVLRELLPGVVEGRTHKTRLEFLLQALSRSELPHLLSRLDAALQERDRLVEHIEKLIEDAGGKT